MTARRADGLDRTRKGAVVRQGLSDLERQIDFVLTHPDMSPWLKTALGEAVARDPVEVLNDLEILNQILPRRCRLMIEIAHHAPGANAKEVH